MKKWAVFLLALACCIGFVSCGDEFVSFPEESTGYSSESGRENTVTVVYDLGALKNDSFAFVAKTEEELPYGAKINPPTPACEGYIFKGWETADGEPVEGTVYALNDGFTLIAVWEKDLTADRWYSPWV